MSITKDQQALINQLRSWQPDEDELRAIVKRNARIFQEAAEGSGSAEENEVEMHKVHKEYTTLYQRELDAYLVKKGISRDAYTAACQQAAACNDDQEQTVGALPYETFKMQMMFLASKNSDSDSD